MPERRALRALLIHQMNGVKAKMQNADVAALYARLKNGKKEYLVRWEGYDAKHDTWEPVENLANLIEEMANFVRQSEGGGESGGGCGE